MAKGVLHPEEQPMPPPRGWGWLGTQGLRPGLTDGRVKTFDVRGAGTGPGQGTFPICNNPAEAITGNYIDGSGVQHGFLRTARKEK
jgi:hypothetical protein